MSVPTASWLCRRSADEFDCFVCTEIIQQLMATNTPAHPPVLLPALLRCNGKLKTTTGKTVQALNTLKNLLHQRLAESEWLSKEVNGQMMTRTPETRRPQAPLQQFANHSYVVDSGGHSVRRSSRHETYTDFVKPCRRAVCTPSSTQQSLSFPSRHPRRDVRYGY